MRCGSTLEAKIRFERFHQRGPDHSTLTWHAALQKVKRRVILLLFERRLLNWQAAGSDFRVDLINQSAKVSQTGWIRNSGTAKEDNATLLVRLQQMFRNVGAVLDELHR